MAGTPRKSVDMSYDSGGNVSGTSGQNSNPPRKAAGSAGEGTYVRKPVGLNAGNLPFKRQPAANQSEYRAGNDSAGAKGLGALGGD